MDTPVATMWSTLVADDDAGIRQCLCLGIEVDHARSWVSARPGPRSRCSTAAGSTLCSSTSGWPRSRGLTILPEILRGQPDVSVIGITAYAFFETAVEAMKVGAVDYLASPPRDGSRPATRQRSGAG